MAKTLKLIIEKGPRKGETLEYNPDLRSTIRIGRIQRGNNLHIKDPGISSNHLSIEFAYNSGHWLITDLESSNGTYVNSKLIDALSGFELNDGDIVKIGELTSIRVVIGSQIDEISTRRNPKRLASVRNLGLEGEGVRVRVLEGGDEDAGARAGAGRGGGGGGGGRGRGRGRPRKGAVVDGEGLEVGENMEVEVKASVSQGVSTRRTRSQKNVEIGEGRMMNSVLEKVSESGGLNGDSDGSEVGENVEGVKASVGRGMSTRRTRSGKNVVNLEGRMVGSVLERVEETEGLDVGENVGVDVKASMGRGMSTRRTRAQKNVENVEGRMTSSVLEKVSESEGLNEDGECLNDSENVEGVKASVGRGMGTRRTRRGKNVENVEGGMVSSVLEKVPESEDLEGGGGMKVEDVGVVEYKKNRGGGRGRKKLVDGVGDVNLDDGKNREVSNVQPREVVGEENSQKMFEVEELGVQENEALNGEKVSSVGVVEDEDKQADCEGKIEELLDVQPREEPVDESSQQKMLEESQLDVPERETSNGDNGEKVENHAVVEDKEKQVGHEKKSSMDTGCSDDASDLDPCKEPVDENSQQNMHEESKSKVSEMEVIEQKVGEVASTEKLSEVKIAGSQQNTVEKADSEITRIPDGGILGAEEQPCIQPMEENDEQNETVVCASHVDQETCDTLQNDEVLKEREVDDSEKSESSDGLCEDSDNEEKNEEDVVAPDLEKMTLGEWFDYMEWYLPKQIRDVTNEIVADMRQKAKLYDEFMLEQRKKGKLP